MKNLYNLIIGILALAVIFLFIQLQSLKGSIKHSEGDENKQEVKPAISGNISAASAEKLPDARIAYVNIDSLNAKYAYISDNDKNLKARQMALEGVIQSMTQKFQQDYESAQQSAKAGILPPAEMEAKKASLERQQRDIEAKQVQMENLQVELQEKNEKMKSDIKEMLLGLFKDKFDYILSYSNSLPTILLVNPKLDITNQVVEALNADYRAKKSNPKK
jgi:outer membrane protein